jgi:hypothetical protein
MKCGHINGSGHIGASRTYFSPPFSSFPSPACDLPILIGSGSHTVQQSIILSPLLSNPFLSFLYKLLVMTVFLVPNFYVFQMVPLFIHYCVNQATATFLLLFTAQWFYFHCRNVLYFSHISSNCFSFYYFTCSLLSGLLKGGHEVRISACLSTEMKVKLSHCVSWRHMTTGGT